MTQSRQQLKNASGSDAKVTSTGEAPALLPLRFTLLRQLRL
jgi:hypothetical protein